ncbi:hypothetical protein S40288_10822 [Stachybotrys chartarum IBT 40288]|nr:hypothetical protein S40288_10822 [Stachybotrys chartarum IBT 40288]
MNGPEAAALLWTGGLGGSDEDDGGGGGLAHWFSSGIKPRFGSSPTMRRRRQPDQGLAHLGAIIIVKFFTKDGLFAQSSTST